MRQIKRFQKKKLFKHCSFNDYRRSPIRYLKLSVCQSVRRTNSYLYMHQLKDTARKMKSIGIGKVLF